MSNQTSGAPAAGSRCSPAVLEAIYGKPDRVAKEAQYNASLGNWWQEYAGRKNDEEHEHVADSLLYDERCHLPRMAQRPEGVAESATTSQTTANASHGHETSKR